jgi:hypothetical protein
MQNRTSLACRAVRRPTITPAFLLCAAIAGCGGGDEARPEAGPATTATVPALARTPPEKGEIVFRAEGSPVTKGPFAFRGSYTVRFEQYAPEDPALDFGSQTPFTATLVQHVQGEPDPDRTVKLFQSAARAGRTTIRANGRLDVDVAFGDFPFVLRFTPVASR